MTAANYPRNAITTTTRYIAPRRSQVVNERLDRGGMRRDLNRPTMRVTFQRKPACPICRFCPGIGSIPLCGASSAGFILSAFRDLTPRPHQAIGGSQPRFRPGRDRHVDFRRRQLPHDVALAADGHCAIAIEGGQHACMPQVLAPCLELSGDRHSSSPSCTNVCRKLCGLNTITLHWQTLVGRCRGSGPRCSRSCASGPPLRTDGWGPGQPASPGTADHRHPQSFSTRSQVTHSSTMARTGSPTGKKSVWNVLLNLVRTSPASW